MVNSKSNGLIQGKPATSANSAHKKESRAADWVAAVARLAAKSQPAVELSNKPMPEDFSASDFDIIHARALSSQI